MNRDAAIVAQRRQVSQVASRATGLKTIVLTVFSQNRIWTCRSAGYAAGQEEIPRHDWA